MKKLFMLGAIFSGLLLTQAAFADMGDNTTNYSDSNYAGGTSSYSGGTSGCCPAPAQNACCPADHACDDQPVQSDCWVKYCHYEPCYYTTCRCCEEQVPCYRRCCRYVDEEYQVTKCRYVPQYYCETCCRKVPQYYTVCDMKCCKKYVPEQHCRYVPRYYWKHVGGCCPTTNTSACCPQPSGCCPR